MVKTPNCDGELTHKTETPRSTNPPVGSSATSSFSLLRRLSSQPNSRAVGECKRVSKLWKCKWRTACGGICAVGLDHRVWGALERLKLDMRGVCWKPGLSEACDLRLDPWEASDLCRACGAELQTCCREQPPLWCCFFSFLIRRNL